MDHNYLTVCLSVLLFCISNFATANRNNSELHNEMDLTEEQLKFLTGEFESDGHDHVYKNLGFRWENGNIPYEFEENQLIDNVFKSQILNAISFLNKNLHGCILIRYAFVVLRNRITCF